MSELEPIITRKNQYRGVNPHLQGILLEKTGMPTIWPSFHALHIAHMADFLNEQLPENYEALPEQSLQLVIDDVTTDEPPRTRKPIPDVALYGTALETAATIAKPRVASTWETALRNTLDPEEDFARAVIIRQMDEDVRIGQIVARIELISPTNKPGNSGYYLYQKARIDALYTGTPLIEVDYIHEFPATVPTYPLYPDEANSHPYNIFVSDPRPDVEQGRVRANGFDVDEPLPVVKLPLAGEDTFDFDLNAVYHFTYLRSRRSKGVDYRQQPLRLHTYSPADQARIQQRMAAIAGAYAQGIDLEP
ncbi:MAG: DUF4058 family protein [Burkholderiales bacterium]|nr:DUF4058 family protein [Anaerolineae bacterium]